MTTSESETTLQVLQAAIDMAARGGSAPPEVEAAPIGVYVTDAEGTITYFNPACIDAAGRTPTPGADRWCVTWKLFGEDGAPLPHEDCPMAVAIRSGQPIRDAFAVAARPDGSWFHFTPVPTPVFGADGALLGAVNMLIPADSAERVAKLENEEARCRRLADGVDNARTSDALRSMADEYARKASHLRNLLRPVGPTSH